MIRQMLVASLLVVFALPAAAQNTCDAGKLKCLRNKLSCLIKVHEQSQKKGLPPDAAKLQKCMAKFDGGALPERGCFAKLEAKQDAMKPATIDDHHHDRAGGRCVLRLWPLLQCHRRCWVLGGRWSTPHRLQVRGIRELQHGDSRPRRLLRWPPGRRCWRERTLRRAPRRQRVMLRSFRRNSIDEQCRLRSDGVSGLQGVRRNVCQRKRMLQQNVPRGDDPEVVSLTALTLAS